MEELISALRKFTSLLEDVFDALEMHEANTGGNTDSIVLKDVAQYLNDE